MTMPRHKISTAGKHVIDFYLDGHKAISFCKVCSKEEQELLEPCAGKIENPLDEKKEPAK